MQIVYVSGLSGKTAEFFFTTELRYIKLLCLTN